MLTPTHGGPDADGVPAHDLSSNANACGPYPEAVRVLRDADARHYPDPASTALRVQLAAWHGVAPARIVPAASGSEFIQRISAAVALQGGRAMWQPAQAYGDYARAAHAVGLVRTAEPEQAALLWACDPSSPLGQPEADLAERVVALRPDQTLVLDQAYEPLRLQGALALTPDALGRLWRLVTPNKALGLTGVRAAYAIAPSEVDAALLARVRALAPSWPLGSHGEALLQSWATLDAEDWVAASRVRLREWKSQQIERLHAAGWQVAPSVANFFVATPPPAIGADLGRHLGAWRAQGVKLRDCASFGLPGRLRMAVVGPAAQDVVWRVLTSPVAECP